MRISLLAASPILLWVSNANAADRVWSGLGRDGNWMTGQNWVRGGLPDPGDGLLFPAAGSPSGNTNDFGAGTAFNTLEFSAAGYNAGGNQIALAAGINVTHSAGNTIITLPLSLSANQTFSVSQAGANLFLNGGVSLGFRTLTFDGAGQSVIAGSINSGLGVGGVRKNGTGTLYFFGNSHGYSGSTIVSGGTLRVDGTLTNSRVNINSGGSLRGGGSVNGIIATSGGTVAPGGSTTNALNSSGDVTLEAGSVLNIRLNGTAPETQYDRLEVTGAVTLGGTLSITTGFAVPVGTKFTIIENDGNDDVVGTFAGLPENAVFTINGRPFRIRYGTGLGLSRTNDVTIEAMPALSVWDGGGGQNNDWSIAQNWVGDLLPESGDDLQFGTPGGSPIFAENDFPAGRVFGSITLAGGEVGLFGNSVVLNGRIQTTAAGHLGLDFPVTLRAGVQVTDAARVGLSGIVLSGNQTFSVTHPDGSVRNSGTLDLATYDLTLAFVPLTQTGNFIDPGLGDITGMGTLAKTGAGMAVIGNTDPTVTIRVDEGLLTAKALAGPSVVTAAGSLRAQALADVDIAGGRLQTSRDTAPVTGRIRFVPTGILEVTIGPDHPISGYLQAKAGGAIELTGGTLELHIDEDAETSPAFPVNLISPLGGTVTGTFSKLPEGSRFVRDGHVVSISYTRSGADVVNVTVDPPFFWDGAGGNALWSNAANWDPDYLPPEGSILSFPDGVSNRIVNNDFPAGTTFGRLAFLRDGYLVLGHSINLPGGLFVGNAPGVTNILADLNLPMSDTPIEVLAGAELRLSGVVSGRFETTYSGKLVLSGNAANNLSSARLPIGEVELDKSSGPALGGGIQVGVATMGGSGSAILRLLRDHQIADDAEVEVHRSSTFAVNGQTEVIDRLEGNGTVDLGPTSFSRGRLTVQSGGFDGAISGFGTFAKTGSGAFGLFDSSSFSGPMILQDGALNLEGTVSCTGLILNGGLLRGRGTAPALTANAGVLQPGSGGAASNVRLNSGSVTLGPGATYRALLTGVDPGFENHALNVTGNVDLGGSTLDLDKTGSHVYAAGRTFTLIHNDGSDPITGTFAGLPQGAMFTQLGFRWQISYTGGGQNDVAITVVEALPPAIGSFSIEPGTGQNPDTDTVTINGAGIGGVTYDLLSSADLTNWAVLRTLIAEGTAGGLAFTFTKDPATPQTYYRLRQQ